MLIRSGQGSEQLYWASDYSPVRPSRTYRQSLEVVRKLGLAGNKKVVDRLMAFGAATMTAQEAGNLAFQRFLLTHSKRIDGPLLVLAQSPRRKR